jgi:hypothetical protein
MRYSTTVCARLQGSVSRSQTGWSTTDSHDHDDFGSQSDRSDAGADSPPRGGPRPSADADLVTESMSFEQEDSPPRKTGRAMPVPEVRRSNNQEEEDRSEGSDDASVEEDFEAEASEGSDAEFDFGDTGYAPTSRVAAPRTSTQPPAQARNAFASPEQPRRPVQEEPRDESDHHAQSEHSDQEEDEYGDDGFDEADEDQASGSEDGDRRRAPAVGASAAAPGRQSLYAPSAAAPVRGRQPAQEESRDEESVEESIPEEDDEGDGMSVGQVSYLYVRHSRASDYCSSALCPSTVYVCNRLVRIAWTCSNCGDHVLQDSDEESGDGDFKHSAPGRGGSKPASQAQQGGLSRAGRSGALPGVVNKPAASRGAHYDAMLNSFEDSDEEGAKPAQKNSGETLVAAVTVVAIRTP